MPKITILLTSFNHEKYIQQAIESTLHQTFTDFELIILDDCSSDNSWFLINQYKDARIKAFRSKGPGEIVRQLNNAILKMAHGEYIAIHHSDDIWELDKLEKQNAFLDNHSDIGAVFTWVQLIDEHETLLDGEWFNQENKTQWQWLNDFFLEKNHLNHPSVLIRKQCYEDVGAFRYGLRQTGDAELWSRVLIKYPIHIIQEKLTKHRLFSDKSNTSGGGIEVLIRLSNEWNRTKENFLAINNFDHIVTIFPNLERFRCAHGFDVKFLFAMACLYESKTPAAWQLGLLWLFDLLNDKSSAQNIKAFYDFSYIDFYDLTAQFDVYGTKEIADFRTHIMELNIEIDALRDQLKTLQTHNAKNEIDALQDQLKKLQMQIWK